MSRSEEFANGRGPFAALLLAVLTIAGCGGGDDTPDPGSDGDDPKTAEKKADPAPRPAFEGWKSPVATVMISGQQLGYIEPCGCAPETLAGGIGRRDDLLRQIRERKWPVTAVDLGSTIRRSRRQSEIKFETILSAYHDMGYGALGVGAADLNLGPVYLVSQSGTGPDGESLVPFLSANVRFFDEAEFPGGPIPFRTLKVGEKKVLVASVLVDDPAHPELRPSDDYSIVDPRVALTALLPRIEAEKADLRILLVHGKEKFARVLLEEYDDFQVAVCTGPEEPPSEPSRVGDSLLVSVGKKGKYVGVVGLFDDDENPLRYELVHLDRHRFDETERMHEHMRTYQKRLKDEMIASLGEPAKHPAEAQFVGAKTCGRCHTKAYAKWSTSRHSHAFESLSKGHVDSKGDYPKSELDWIDRSYDPECLACHVTGWDPENVLRYESGFLNAAFAVDDAGRELETRLAGQQCENCHGPGSTHTQLEEVWKSDPKSADEDALKKARVAMRLMVVRDPETGRPAKAVRNENERSLCYRCHDQDNSPKFEFADYWDKVKHPGRD